MEHHRSFGWNGCGSGHVENQSHCQCRGRVLGRVLHQRSCQRVGRVLRSGGQLPWVRGRGGACGADSTVQVGRTAHPPLPRSPLRRCGHHGGATAIRLWAAEDFDAEYVEKHAWKTLKLWQKELAAAAVAPKRRARAPAKPKTEPKKTRKKDAEEAEKPKPKRGKGLDEATKAKLQAKLKKVRELRNAGGGAEKSPVEEVPDSEEDGDHGSGRESTGYSPTPPLNTGSMLEGSGRKKRRSREKDPSAKEGTLALYKGTRGASMQGLTGQLLEKALAVQDVREKNKKKAKKKSSRTQAVSLLQQILTGKSEKKESRSGEKKKKKKRKRTLKNGVIVSSSNSSESTSKETEEESKGDASSEEDLEAPLRKRSRDAPGSALSLLTEHVREQMQQDAFTEVGGRAHQVTGGVKLTTFFNMHVRPNYGGHLKELREMYMLSVTIDLLRKGDLAKVGDSLSARFMALHQSLVDQSWSTARHMELYPMEEATAASSALILASRKHGRLVDKVQGKGNWGSWQGKGKQNRQSDWGTWSDSQPKGRKGKGPQNKGKGKGKNPWQKGGEKNANEWEKNKDAADLGK